MSSDTAKENASVVDSSVTEWKHEMENLVDQESPSSKGNEEVYPNGREVSQYSLHQVGPLSSTQNGKLYGTRYFIIKSLSHENLQVSIEKGIWATQKMNENILNEAFHNSSKVILIFSVNMSGHFQGYAEMVSSSVGWRRDVWGQASGGKNPWGNSFDVNWLRLHDLPFQETLHLKNPLNEYKPVKISRDCQELPEEIGKALCQLLGEPETNPNFERDDRPSKMPYNELSCPIQGVQSDTSAMHLAWAQPPIPYPSMLYQYPAEAHLPMNPAAAKSSRVKRSRVDGAVTSAQLDGDCSTPFDVWGWSADRSPLASTLTEDDILDMSYEEYLEAHSRGTKLPPSVAGSSRRTRESARPERSDDSYSRSSSKKRSRRSSSDK